uniref:Uncharacterized protein LOC102800502 n=1 Tax=Saccoglossus kowalevskii TaxID=10224 RepID=A0ABM0MZA3_SACKO|nr:PREDICTED: uncharacterized protein LOC102800502 [Saccoglossus kowalevskii]
MAASVNRKQVAFHFYRPGILDIDTGEFFYLSEEESGDAKMVQFIDGDKKVMFTDNSMSHVYVYDTMERRLVRRLSSFSGGKLVEELFVVGDMDALLTRCDRYECGSLWKTKKSGHDVMKESCIFTTHLAHPECVNAMVLVDNTSCLLAITGSADKNIRIWNITSYAGSREEFTNEMTFEYNRELLETFSDRKPYLRRIVHRIEALNDEKKVALVDNMGKHITLYDMSSGKEISTQEWNCPNKHRLDGMASTVSGKRLFGIGGLFLQEYNSDNLQPLTKTPKKLDPNCIGLIAENGNMSLLLGGSNYVDTIYIYDINKEWYMETYRPPSRPQHIFILSGHRMLLPCTNDLAMVDLTTGDSIYSHHYRQRFGDSSLICGELSKDEALLVTGWNDGFIKLIRVDSGEIVHNFEAHHKVKKARYSDGGDIFRDILLSNNNKFIVAALSDEVQVRSVMALEQCHFLTGHNAPVSNVKITGDDQYVLTSAGMNVIVWSSVSGGRLMTVTEYWPIDVLHILPKSNRVIVTTVDGRVMFYNVNNQHAGALQAHDTQTLDQLQLRSQQTLIGESVLKKYTANKGLPPLPAIQTASKLSTKDLPYHRVTAVDKNNCQIVSELKPSHSKCTITQKHRQQTRQIRKTRSPRSLRLHTDYQSLGNPLVMYGEETNQSNSLLGRQLLVHTDEVISLAATSDGQLFISGSKDKTAILWNIETCSKIHTFVCTYPVARIGITPDDLKVITYGYNGTNESIEHITVWHIESGEHLFDLQGHTGLGHCDMQFTADSNFAISEMYNKYRERSSNRYKYCFIVWSLEDGKQLYEEVEAHKGRINDIVLAQFAEGHQIVVTCGAEQDPGIKLWDLLTGQLLKVILDRTKLQRRPCRKMSVSSDGQCVAFHFYRPGILNVNTGVFSYLSEENYGDAQMIKFINDDSEVMFFSTHNYLTVYNIKEARVVLNMVFGGGHGGMISQIFFSDDFKTIVTQHHRSECGVVWMAQKKPHSTKCELKFLANLRHQQIVNDIRYITTGLFSYAVTASSDRSIRIWNIEDLTVSETELTDKIKPEYHRISGELFRDRKPHIQRMTHRVEILDDESHMAVIGNWGTNITLFDIEHGTKIVTQEWDGLNKRELDSLTMTSDSTRLFGIGGFALREYNPNNLEQCAHKPKKLDIPCIGMMIPNDCSRAALLVGSTYVEKIQIFDINKGWYIKEYKTQSRPGNIILLSGQRILMVCLRNLVMLDVNSGNEIYNISFPSNYKAGQMLCGAITKEEHTLVTGWDNGYVKIFEIESGKPIHEFSAHNLPSDTRYRHTFNIFTVITISTNGKFFMTASSDKTAKLWDMKSYQEKYTFVGHTGTVVQACITGDDRYVLTVADVDLKIWSVSSGQQLINILHYPPVDCLYILPFTNKVVITTADDKVLFFNIDKQMEQEIETGSAQFQSSEKEESGVTSDQLLIDKQARQEQRMLAVNQYASRLPSFPTSIKRRSTLEKNALSNIFEYSVKNSAKEHESASRHEDPKNQKKDEH